MVRLFWVMLVIGYIKNINLISAFYRISASSKLFQNRASHAFVYKISGESLYTFRDKKILLSQDEILFIPKGESYSVKLTCPEESRYALINFDADIENPVPFLYPLSGGMDYSFLFYKLLFSLSESNERAYYNVEKKQLIEPAIQYLNQHIFDSSLKTEYLHTLCNISDTYFRKIFISIFGLSPKQYIINRRMVQAKNIIDSGEYNTIYEVSEAVGYTDALYFGKLFKKHYGIPPSKK